MGLRIMISFGRRRGKVPKYEKVWKNSLFNHCKIDSETDTEESEDNYRTEKEAESNEKRRRFVKFKSSSEEESNEDQAKV